jgi:gluconokinase
MRSGVPLGDADRAGWLDALANELAARPQGAVLTCSALKRAYRDRLRAASADLRFVHLSLPQAEAQRRVASRPGHFYPPALVASQFAALEDPAGEPGVVTVDACLPLDEVARRAVEALHR